MEGLFIQKSVLDCDDWEWLLGLRQTRVPFMAEYEHSLQHGVQRWTHIQVEVEAHEGLRACGGQLCQVGQIADARAVELQDLRVVDLLIAQRGIAGQHLGQHHYLRSHPNLSVNYIAVLMSSGLCSRLKICT